MGIQNVVEKDTVFVVEDEMRLYSTLNILLKRTGYQVVICENGKEAFRKINYHLKNNLAIDLVLTDIIMPEMDGIQLIFEINKLNREIPCIAMTGHGNIDMRIQLIELSCAGYLEKPINAETLLSEVEHVLEFSKWRKKL
jgi:DNA-binding NtrC family response regulator